MVTKLDQLKLDTAEKATTACVPAGSAHDWEKLSPDGVKSTADKIKDMKASASVGTQFEGAAADHNKVSNSKNLSEGKGAEMLTWICVKCGLHREGDHTLDDPSGKPVIVEVKACTAMDARTARQLARNLATAAGGNAAGVVMKVPSGGKYSVLVHQIKEVAAEVAKTLGKPVGDLLKAITRVPFP